MTHLQSTPDFSEITFLSSSGALVGTSSDAAINFDDSHTTSMFLQRRSTLPGSTPAQVASSVARTEISRTTTEQNTTLIDCRTRRPRSRSFGDTTTVELPVFTLPVLRASDPPHVEDNFHQAQEATLDGEMAAFSQTAPGEAAQSVSGEWHEHEREGLHS